MSSVVESMLVTLVTLRPLMSVETSWLVVLTEAEFTQRVMVPRFWPAMPPV